MDDVTLRLQDLAFIKEMALKYFKENPNTLKLMGFDRMLSSDEKLSLCYFQASLVLLKKYGFDTDKVKIVFDDSTS